MRWRNPAIILVVSLLVYGNTLSAGFVWDDLLFITGKSPIRRLDSIPLFFSSDIARGTEFPHATPYYRPLHSTMMAIQYSLWGERPAGYHLINILLQAGIAILIFVLARQFQLSGRAALAASLLYTVHPVRAEGVAYLGSSSELQYVILLLGAFVLYLRGRESSSLPALAGALACYSAGLLTKESAAVLPLLLLGCEIVVPAGRISERCLRVSAFALVTALFLKVRFMFVPVIAWQEHPLSDRIFTGIGIIARYLWNLIAPFDLRVFYDVPLKLSLARLDVILPLAGLLVLLLLVISSYRKSRRVVFFSAWTVIGMLPASGLPAILLPSPMADRYLTLSLAGFAVLVGILFDAMSHSAGDEASYPQASAVGTSGKCSSVTVACLVMIVLFGATTAHRNLLWKDHETLVTRMIADAPGHFLGYELLGTLQGQRGDYAAMAASYYRSEEKTIARNLELGRQYLAAGRVQETMALYRRMMDKFPLDVRVLSALGAALEMQGRPFEAMEYYRKGLSVCPECGEIRENIERIRKAGSWNYQ